MSRVMARSVAEFACEMVCTNQVRLGEAEDMLIVPCGRCAACRVRRTAEWAVRLYHELHYWDHACFVTLTYDDDHLPVDLSVHKDELVRYVRRLRYRLGRRIKYFACGEYGMQFDRPHYHLLVFGLAMHEHKRVRRRSGWQALTGPAVDAWRQARGVERGAALGTPAHDASRPARGDGTGGAALGTPRGNVYVGTVTYHSARYVAGYIQKKLFGPPGQKHESYEDREAPFQIQSLGIGRRYCEEYWSELLREGGCTIHGKRVGVPRYYAKCVPELVPLLKVECAELREERAERIRDRYSIPEDDFQSDRVYGAYLAENAQREQNFVKLSGLRSGTR